VERSVGDDRYAKGAPTTDLVEVRQEREYRQQLSVLFYRGVLLLLACGWCFDPDFQSQTAIKCSAGGGCHRKRVAEDDFPLQTDN